MGADGDRQALSAAAVIAIARRGRKVLLVRRRDDRGRFGWVFPGGKLEPNESEFDAVVREVREETGLVCAPVRRLGDRVHPVTKVPVSYWICEYTKGKLRLEDEKFGLAAWVDVDQLDKLPSSSIYPPVLEYLRKETTEAA